MNIIFLASRNPIIQNLFVQTYTHLARMCVLSVSVAIVERWSNEGDRPKRVYFSHKDIKMRSLIQVPFARTTYTYTAAHTIVAELTIFRYLSHMCFLVLQAWHICYHVRGGGHISHELWVLNVPKVCITYVYMCGWFLLLSFLIINTVFFRCLLYDIFAVSAWLARQALQISEVIFFQPWMSASSELIVSQSSVLVIM